ncbi:MAG: hypothetical protein KatS3mg038_1042 [Candidatus Kapaibacterium sp.]|nr:MAG: hypothetical protein KatS3mg038_1042 [Candidatus Kapabacteria bacterium]
MPVYDYRIAAGHNVPLASLVNIETIVPAGDVAFYPPRAFGTYNAGNIRVRADGRLYFAGYPSIRWDFGLMTRAQFLYLQTTYCNGGYSGPVTIYTRLDRHDEYKRCNAIMVLPQLADLDNSGLTRFLSVGVKMTRLEVLS